VGLVTSSDGDTSTDDVATAFVGARDTRNDVEARRMRADVEQRLFSGPRDPVRIDRYSILERVGKGGLGAVYAAYDPKLDRRVALKLLQPSADGSTCTEDDERLLREAQALAKLSHPNVIAVHDAGRFEGQVFITMELVEGIDLREWSRVDRTWREVRDTFLAAGRGLSAAHAAGLVHRDFKPSNVLVGKDGRVRVLDFGLAKLTDQAVDPPTPGGDGNVFRSDAELTAAGTIMGTPAFMAPEQHDGADVGPAADQYAFCAALFEALHGHRPFKGKDLDELMARKRGGQIEPGRRRVPAWIDRVIARGLQPRPEDRFPSMEALLRDLDRDPARTALRWAGAASVVAALAAVFFLGRTAKDDCGAIDDRVAKLWSDEARAEIATAFTSTGVSFAGATWDTIRPALDDHLQRWAARRTEVCKAEDEQGTQTPEAICLERCFVAVSELLGVFARADEDIVENAVLAVQALPAVESCARVPGGSANQAVAPSEVARDVDVLIARGRALRRAGKYEEAKSVLEQALARARSDGAGYGEAEVLSVLGSVTDSLGKASEAEPLLWEAVGLAEAEGDDRVAAEAMAELVFVIGFGGGRHDEALRLAALAHAKIERSGNDAVLLGDLENNRGVVLNDAGRYDEAEQAHRIALELRSSRFGADSLGAASSYNNLGNVAFARGDNESALASFEKAIAIYRGALGEGHPNVISPQGNRAAVLMRTGRAAEAEQETRAIIEILKKDNDGEHPLMVIALANLGSAIKAQDRNEEALQVFQDARELSRRVMGEKHPITTEVLTGIGGVLAALGRSDEATALYQQAIDEWKESIGPDHPNLAHAYIGLGELQREAGDEAAARKSFEEASRIRSAALGADHDLTKEARAKLEGAK